MELKQLRSFVEVVRHGSFTQAAERLHSTQSTISKQVAQLEQRLGEQLFERNGPHIRLTDAGKLVLTRAEEMLRLQRELRTELDDLSQLHRGELRLGLPLLGGEALLTSLITRYRQRYPQIIVHLSEGGSKMLEKALLEGELDLASSLTPSDPAFDYQPFVDEPLDILLGASHPLSGRQGLALEELADSPFLLYQESFALNDRILLACRQAGFVPREVGRSGQPDLLSALVASGQGVVLMPRLVARKMERPGLVRMPLLSPPLRWDLAFVWRRGAYLSRAAKAWLELAGERQPD